MFEELKRRNLQNSLAGDDGLVRRLTTVRNSLVEQSTVRDCLAKGYAPLVYGLADFSILRRGDLYHLFHIPRVPGGNCNVPGHEHWFGHATSTDLDTWITRNPVLHIDPVKHYESAHVWAPYVLEKSGRAYMYYAGLSLEPSQVMCGAFSDDGDLAVWHKFDHNPLIPLAGFDWHWLNDAGHVRHGRDPHVVDLGDHHLMLYTAMHKNGSGAVGGMVSTDLFHWQDIGPVLYRPSPRFYWWPESVNVQQLPDERWTMIVSMSPGLDYYVGDDPHAWHGLEPKRVAYVGGDADQLGAPEVLVRDDAAGRWLIAWFERERLFVGVLDLKVSPWTVQRLTDPAELRPWLER